MFLLYDHDADGRVSYDDIVDVLCNDATQPVAVAEWLRAAIFGDSPEETALRLLWVQLDPDHRGYTECQRFCEVIAGSGSRWDDTAVWMWLTMRCRYCSGDAAELARRLRKEYSLFVVLNPL